MTGSREQRPGHHANHRPVEAGQHQPQQVGHAVDEDAAAQKAMGIRRPLDDHDTRRATLQQDPGQIPATFTTVTGAVTMAAEKVEVPAARLCEVGSSSPTMANQQQARSRQAKQIAIASGPPLRSRLRRFRAGSAGA